MSEQEKPWGCDSIAVCVQGFFFGGVFLVGGVIGVMRNGLSLDSVFPMFFAVIGAVLVLAGPVCLYYEITRTNQGA